MSRDSRLPMVSNRTARMLSVLKRRTFNPEELERERERLSFRKPPLGLGLTFNLSGDRMACSSRLGSASLIGGSCCCWMRERKLILKGVVYGQLIVI